MVFEKYAIAIGRYDEGNTDVVRILMLLIPIVLLCVVHSQCLSIYTTKATVVAATIEAVFVLCGECHGFGSRAIVKTCLLTQSHHSVILE